MREIPRSTWVLSIAALLTMLGVTLVAPILPLYAREFGVSRVAAGVLISAFAAARLGFDLVGGALADRFGSRRVMVTGAVTLALSSALAALAPNFAVLFVARVLEGAGAAAFAMAAMQYIVLTTPKERLGRTMALFQTGLLTGIAIGPFVGGRAADIGDFTTPFWIYAVVGLAVAVVAMRYVTDAPPSGKSILQTYQAAGRLLRSPAYLGLLFVILAIFVMRGGARITLLPLYAGEVLGLSAGDTGTILAAGALVTVIATNPVGFLVDRIGRTPVLAFGLVTSGIAIALHGAARSFGTLVLISLVFGLCSTFLNVPPPTLAGDLAPEGSEGASVGLYRVTGDIGLVIGPIMLGAVAEGGWFTAAFVISGALLAAAAVVAVLIPEPDRTSAPTLAAGAEARP